MIRQHFILTSFAALQDGVMRLSAFYVRAK